jgi:hypothetical protein
MRCHMAITNVYRASRDLFLAQRFARHANPLTTVCNAHLSESPWSDVLTLSPRVGSTSSGCALRELAALAQAVYDAPSGGEYAI